MQQTLAKLDTVGVQALSEATRFIPLLVFAAVMALFWCLINLGDKE